jgi:hypothetical protein
MNEIRYASLSGSLLARKGGAKPAMRPQPFATNQLIDDLGWDDHGDAPEPISDHVPSSIAALTPAPKPTPSREEVVHVQQRVLSDHFGGEEPEEAPAAPAPIAAPPPVPAPATVAKAAPARPARAAADKPRRRAAADRPIGQKAAFTLRLDAERHLRLRLASAVYRKSSQQLVTAALDAFLEDMPDVGNLVRQLPTRGAN